MPYVPTELIGEIASRLENPSEIADLRLVNKRFHCAVEMLFVKSVADNLVVYPRYASIQDLLSLFNSISVLPLNVFNITLIAEGLGWPRFGYYWAWEHMQMQEDVDFTEKDCKIIEAINAHHADDMAFNGSFITGGGYRTMISKGIPDILVLRYTLTSYFHRQPCFSPGCPISRPSLSASSTPARTSQAGATPTCSRTCLSTARA